MLAIDAGIPQAPRTALLSESKANLLRTYISLPYAGETFSVDRSAILLMRCPIDLHVLFASITSNRQALVIW